MKKTFLYSTVLFLCLTVFVQNKAMAYAYEYGRQNFFAVWSFGEIGAGIINSNIDFNAKLFDLFLQHKLSSFGLEIIPVEYNYSKFYDGHIVSFLNTKLYLSSMTEYSQGYYSIASPFISIRALNIPNFYSYNYVIDAGFKFAMYFVESGGMVWNFFAIETGYKYFKQDRKHAFFINISTGIPLLFPLGPFLF